VTYLYSRYFTAISNSGKNPIYFGKSLADESVDVLWCRVGHEPQVTEFLQDWDS